MDAYRDVRGFFRERLLQALASLEIATAKATEQYLVELLSTFASADRIQDMQTPFVDLLTHAYEAPRTERAFRMRGIGDSALFVSGYLADSMNRRGITFTYCCSVGRRAYAEAGNELGGEALSDLAQRFPAFVRVLDEVREQTAQRTDGELVRLYERWLDNDSPELFRRLSRCGVLASRKGIHA
jgi:hypothetical protein